MRRAAIGWERAAEVRAAADAWLRAGAIAAQAREAIRERYPDPCVRPSAVWRILTAAMVTVVIVCTLTAVATATALDMKGMAVLLLVAGLALLALTEALEASPQWSRRGAAGATAFWGVVSVLGGVVQFTTLEVMWLAGTLLWAASCWRWGNPIFAAFSGVSLFLFLAGLPVGRVLWLLAGTAIAAVVARRGDDPGWAPSHRGAATVLLVTAIGAVYVAVNIYSLDERLVERLSFVAISSVPPSARPRAPAAIGTAVMPLLILGWAWASRRTVLLDTGIVLAAVSLVTLRHYVRVAPLWIVLIVAGAGLIVLMLAVERTLRRRTGGEIHGITADALFTDERREHVLQSVAAFTPAAPVTATDDKGFAGRGGAFGGGGASDKF